MIARAAMLLGDSEVTTWLRKAYRPEKRWAAGLPAVCEAVCGLGRDPAGSRR